MDNSWIYTILAELGAPATPQNVAFLQAWQTREGPLDNYNNPLNITKAYLGGTWGQGGSQGDIQGFTSLQVGAENTASFLSHGYTNIVAALKSGNPQAYGNQNGLANELSAWSGGGYSGIAGVGNASGSGGNSSPNIGGFLTAPFNPQLWQQAFGGNNPVSAGIRGATEGVGLAILSVLLIFGGLFWMAIAATESKPGQTIIETTKGALAAT